MPAENAPQPVLPYETPDAREAIAFLPAMRAWRRVAAWGFWSSVGALLLYPPAAAGTVPMLVACGIASLARMTRAAAREVGTMPLWSVARLRE